MAGLLATSGYRVLVVDLHPQGNLAEDLGYTDDSRDDKGRSLAQALMFGGGASPVLVVRTGLDVLVGGSVLDQATAGLSSRANKDPDGAKLALAQLLAPLAPDYDMILIDCPPGDETLQTAAVAAARWALVPVKTDKSSRKGLGAVASRLDAVLCINPTLDLLGVVLTAVGSGALAVQREAREQIAALSTLITTSFSPPPSGTARPPRRPLVSAAFSRTSSTNRFGKGLNGTRFDVATRKRNLRHPGVRRPWQTICRP